MRLMYVLFFAVSLMAYGQLGIESKGDFSYKVTASPAFTDLVDPALEVLATQAPCLSDAIHSVFESVKWQLVNGELSCTVTPSFIKDSIETIGEPAILYEEEWLKCSKSIQSSLMLIRALGKLNYDWTVEAMLTVKDVILSRNFEVESDEMKRLEIETCSQ